LILLGTDGLEKVFGKVRTITGNDTSADQFQLANRIDGAVKCVNILEKHPEWGGQARRLSVKPLPKNATKVTSAYDHINPRAWKGNVHVRDVVLSACWSSGRSVAEAALREAKFSIPFEEMEKLGGFDILWWACFVCEDDSMTSADVDLDTCRLCRKVKLSSLSGPALVIHMSAHILHDPRLKDSQQPCGFCLNMGLCTIQLQSSSKSTTIDVKAS